MSGYPTFSRTGRRRLILRLLLALSLLCLVAFIGIGTWLTIRPRALPFLIPTITQALKENTGAKEAALQPPLIHLNLKKWRLEAELRELSLNFTEGRALAHSLRIALPFGALLRGDTGLAAIASDDIALSLPGKSGALTIPSFRIDPDAAHAGRSAFAIDLGQITKGAEVHGTVDSLNEGGLEIDARLNEVPASLASLLLPDAKGLDARLTGQALLHLPSRKSERRADINLFASGITFSHPVWYPNPEKPMRLDSLSIRAAWNEKAHSLTLYGFNAVQDTMNLGVNGATDDTLRHGHLHADIRQLPVDKIYAFWPRGISDEARDWVVKRLEDGRIADGKAEITLKFDKDTPIYDAVKVDSLLNVEGVRVIYSDTLPQVTGAEGKVRITDDGLSLHITDAHLLNDTRLLGGVIAIRSFSDPAIPISINLDLEGSAKDVATYILPQYLNKAASLHLKPETIEGRVKGKLVLTLPLYPERAGLGTSSYDHLEVAIKAELEDIAQKGIMGKWNASDFSGLVRIDTSRVALEAKGQLQGAPATIEVTHHYESGKPVFTDYHVTLALLDSQFAAFDIPLKSESVEGKVLLDATIHEAGDEALTKAELNMTDADLRISEIDWTKPKGQKASLKAVQRVKGKSSVIESLIFDTKDAKAEGKVTLDEAGNPVSAKFASIHTPNMTIAANYSTREGHQDIRITGERLNLRKQEEKADKQAKAGRRQDAPRSAANPFDGLLDRTIHIALGSVETKETTFRHLSFDSECDKTRCTSLAAHGSYGKDASFKASLTQKEKKRPLTVDISDTGTLLAAFSDTKNLEIGRLTFDGAYDDALPTHPLDGALNIRKLVVKDVPVVTQLLSLASLRGIADTVLGDGIAFDSIASDITYENELLTLKNMAVKGDAMGVVLSGTVQPFGAGALDLNGTLAPSYALNALPGKVPLVGELLVGGKDQGVFGARFSVAGTISKPDISANPLSILTPGFLRNIFNVFNDPKKGKNTPAMPEIVPSQGPEETKPVGSDKTANAESVTHPASQ